MKPFAYLFSVLWLALLLVCCSPALHNVLDPPPGKRPPTSSPTDEASANPDSAAAPWEQPAVKAAPLSWAERLRRLTRTNKPLAAAYGVLPGKKVKNSTIIIQTGTGNGTGTVGDTKLKGSQMATDSSVLNVAGTGGNIAATRGNGNSTEQKPTVTTEEAPDWKATLAGPVGWVLGLVALAAVVYGGVRYYSWRKARALVAILLLVSLSLPALSCTRRGYSYKEARQTERKYNRVVRYYKQKNRRDTRELRRYNRTHRLPNASAERK